VGYLDSPLSGWQRTGSAAVADDAPVDLWLAVAFSLTNGLHDAANAIATLVATRAAQPGGAIALSAVFNMLGALLVGTAVPR
jgi:phosphate/sulfate permease